MLLAVRIWIVLSTLVVSAGWILSALHQLNRVGYGITFALALAAGIFWGAKSGWLTGVDPGRALRKARSRFRKPLPALFLATLLLSLLGGWLYPSDSGDTNSYRIPRVLHWLGREQWHWIHTLDSRMNFAGTGYEWLMAPLVLFTGNDRGFFLGNWVSYLLLPGLIYSVLTRLRVAPRVAWWWMWLLASGWCYALQAESTINDLFAVVYALASVDFALRARQTGSVADGWLAVLSAGLLTGAKQTCLPLALVSATALWPVLRLLAARPWPSLLAGAAALLVSAVPVTGFNLWHTGNWMGVSAARYGWSNITLDSPFWGFWGNVFCLTAQNMVPPFFPWYNTWNAAMQHFLETPFGAHFRSFEVFGLLSQSASAASSGIGLGICLITLFSVWRARQFRPASGAGRARPADGLIWWLWLTPWVALLAIMTKVGAYENARYLSPYYILFYPVWLAAPGHRRVVRERWWRRLAVLLAGFTVLLVVTVRGMPLFPAQTLFGWLHEKYPHSEAFQHVLVSFSSQNDVKIQREAFRSELPPAEKIIGYYSVICCGSEPGFWQPFGSRRVERILPGDSRAYVRSLGIYYVVVDEQALTATRQTIDDWLREYDGELVAQVVFNMRWGAPQKHLYLARLRPSPAAGTGVLPQSPARPPT